MTRHDTIHRRGKSVRVERRPLNPRTALARLRAHSVEPEPEVERRVELGSAALPTSGPLAADVLRHVDHVRGRFGAALVGGVL